MEKIYAIIDLSDEYDPLPIVADMNEDKINMIFDAYYKEKQSCRIFAIPCGNLDDLCKGLLPFEIGIKDENNFEVKIEQWPETIEETICEDSSRETCFRYDGALYFRFFAKDAAEAVERAFQMREQYLRTRMQNDSKG